MRQTKKDFFGKEQTFTVPATVQDGLLKIGTGSLFGGTLTYVKATDRITTAAMLGGDIEYERAKEILMFRMNLGRAWNAGPLGGVVRNIKLQSRLA